MVEVHGGQQREVSRLMRTLNATEEEDCGFCTYMRAGRALSLRFTAWEKCVEARPPMTRTAKGLCARGAADRVHERAQGLLRASGPGADTRA